MQRRYALGSLLPAALAVVLIILIGSTRAQRAQAAPGAPAGASPTPCVARWQQTDTPNIAGTEDALRAVAGLAPDDVWAVGEAHYGSLQTIAMHWDGQTWSLVASPNPGSGVNALRGVATLSHADVWAVGTYQTAASHTLVAHWDGTQWRQVPDADPAGGQLNAVAAVAPDDIWAVGSAADGPIREHWDGTTWTLVPGPAGGALSGIAAVGPDDVWAVNQDGTTQQWDGHTWTLVPGAVPGATLRGVTAVARDDVWAVGWNGEHTVAEHWDGSAWRQVATADPASRGNAFYAVAAAGAGDVFAVGSARTSPTGRSEVLVERWDGNAWAIDTSTPPLNPFDEFYGVAALSPQRVWAAGYYWAGTFGPAATLAAQFVDDCAADPTPVVTPPGAATATRPPAPGSTPTPLSCARAFSDVPPGSPFAPYVYCLACQGVVAGYGDGTFRPASGVTRGQAAKFVANAGGYADAIPATRQTFVDVPPDDPFWLYVERAAARGVIGGYAGGTYRPAAGLTRGQAAKIVTVAGGYRDAIPAGRQTFADVPARDPFWLAVERAAAHGVIAGYADGTYRPGAGLTRGQQAKLLTRTFFPACGAPAR